MYPSLTAPNRWHFFRGVFDLFNLGERRGGARYRLEPSLHKKLARVAYFYSKTASPRPIVAPVPVTRTQTLFIQLKSIGVLRHLPNIEHFAAARTALTSDPT
jgi:hypothetical protein